MVADASGAARAAPSEGIRQRLTACASEGGTFAVLALDHRQNLRRMLRPDDPGAARREDMVEFKRAVLRLLAPAATGTLLDPEVGLEAAAGEALLSIGSGLIVAVDATGYEGPSTARRSRILDGWSVEQVKLAGASAAKLLVHYHPEAANAADQERLVSNVAGSCQALGLPLFLEPLSFSVVEGSPLTGEARRAVVVETARRLTAIGGDVLKAEFPYDAAVTDHDRWADACAELDTASAVPWVLLSGGVDDSTFEAQVEVACDHGASGVVAGRSVWAEAVTMEPAARDRFLATTAKARLERLVALADRVGQPWHERRSGPRQVAPAAPHDGDSRTLHGA
jgi:tagatose 1,6-diphosphate aldolase